jgi:transcriptional regulator with XRE-family HTH domain
MTLRQVAARSGYSPATLSMAESGRRFPSWEVLEAFVQSCGADPGEWRPLWRSAAESEDTGQPTDTADAGSAVPAQQHRLPRIVRSKTAAISAGCAAIAAAAWWVTISQLAAQPPGTHAADPAKSSPAAPARVVAPEPCGALQFAADGVADSVTCPDGRPNLAADRYYRQMRLRVLTLGPDATPMQVDAAVCADLATGKTTFPIETRAVELASAEEAWHFGVDPASNVGPGLCPRPARAAGRPEHGRYS